MCSSDLDRINAIALRGGSFDEAQAVLRGNVALSRIFKIGENPVDDKGRPLSSINASKLFLEEFIQLPLHSSSRVITAESGLYIYTPVLKDIKTDTLPKDDKEQASIASRLEQESIRMLSTNMMQKLYEKSKIIKNLKTD